MATRMCPVCGKYFILPAQPLYKTNKGGRTLISCSYACWNKSKTMSLEEHKWVAYARKGTTIKAGDLLEQMYKLLSEHDIFICEFEGHRWLAYAQLTGVLFYTRVADDRSIVRDLFYVPKDEQIKFISNTKGKCQQYRKIDDLLTIFKCKKLEE